MEMVVEETGRAREAGSRPWNAFGAALYPESFRSSTDGLSLFEWLGSKVEMVVVVVVVLVVVMMVVLVMVWV